MNRMIFIMKDSVKGIVREWKMNLCVVGVLFGTMLLVAYCLSSIRFLQKDTERLKYEGVENTIEVSVMNEFLKKEQIQNILEKSGAGRSTVFSVQKDSVSQINHNAWFVLGIDSEWRKYHDIVVHKGVFPRVSDSAAECLIGSECAKESGLGIGSKVMFGRTKFEITGITKENRYKKYIILPYDRLRQQNTPQKVQQTLLLTGEGIEVDRINEILAEEQIDEILYCEDAFVNYNQMKTQMEKWIRLRIFAGAIGIVFATFNILAVCFGKIQERKKEYVLKKVMGLSEGGVLLSFFVENILLFVTAGVLALGVFVPITHLLKIDSVVLLGGASVLAMFCVMVVLTMVYAIVLVAYLKRYSMIDIIEGES